MKHIKIFLFLATFLVITSQGPLALAAAAQDNAKRIMTYSFIKPGYRDVYLNPNHVVTIILPVAIQDVIIGNKGLINIAKKDTNKIIITPRVYEGETNIVVWINDNYQVNIEIKILEDTKKGDRIVEIQLPEPVIDDINGSGNNNIATLNGITPQPTPQPIPSYIPPTTQQEPEVIPPTKITINKTETSDGVKATVNYIEENPDGFVIDLTIKNNTYYKPFISNMTKVSVKDEYNQPRNILKYENVNYPVFYPEPKNWRLYIQGVRPKIIYLEIQSVADPHFVLKTSFPGQ